MAASQPPAANDQPAANATQPAAPDQRGTDNVPLTVTILPAPDAKEQADKAEHAAREKAIIDETIAFETQRIADYTERLAWFTVAVFLATVLLGAGTMWAALAASKSADSFASAERPHLLISNLKIRIRLDLMETENDSTIPVSYSFVIGNHGRSPAFVSNYSFQLEAGELPETPAYIGAWRDKNIIITGYPMVSTSDDRILGNVPVGTTTNIQANEVPLYMFGVVEYSSIFKGKSHRLRFCYRMFFDKDQGHLSSVLSQPEGPDSYWEYT